VFDQKWSIQLLSIMYEWWHFPDCKEFKWDVQHLLILWLFISSRASFQVARINIHTPIHILHHWQMKSYRYTYSVCFIFVCSFSFFLILLSKKCHAAHARQNEKFFRFTQTSFVSAQYIHKNYFFKILLSRPSYFITLYIQKKKACKLLNVCIWQYAINTNMKKKTYAK